MAAFEISFGILRLGTYYKLYEKLTARWRGVLPGFIYEIKYDDLINDQKRGTISLIDFCDMTWDDACLRFFLMLIGQ